MPQEALILLITEERYWVLFYMPLYKFLHNCWMYWYRLLIKWANKNKIQFSECFDIISYALLYRSLPTWLSTSAILRFFFSGGDSPSLDGLSCVAKWYAINFQIMFRKIQLKQQQQTKELVFAWHMLLPLLLSKQKRTFVIMINYHDNNLRESVHTAVSIFNLGTTCRPMVNPIPQGKFLVCSERRLKGRHSHSGHSTQNLLSVRDWTPIYCQAAYILEILRVSSGILGTHGSVVGWGTVLQAGRSWVGVPVMSQNFFNLPNPPSCTRSWGLLSL
jgi:hypothetical protein